MKKSLIALSLTALLVSCKKEVTPEAFTPTDMTGTATIKGNTTKNVVTPNGAGGWVSTSRVPAAGVNVTVRIPKSGAVGTGLYPNSTAQGSDVYSGQTDVNGNYNIAVKANGSGVAATIVIDGFTATLDTVINGVKKPGLYASYVGVTIARTAWTGQTSWGDHNFVATNLTTNPNAITVGSALLTGSVGMALYTQSITANSSTVAGPPSGTTMIAPTTTVVPSGHKVYVSFDMDPLQLVAKAYETSTDASGGYSFNLSTVAAGTNGFPNQTATVWIADFAAKKDTVRITSAYSGTTAGVSSTVVIAGKMGVFGNQSTVQTGLYNNEIRNATNLSYGAGSFTPN